MKKQYILGISLIASVGFFAMQKSGVESVEKYFEKNGHTFSAGSPIEKTGAPLPGGGNEGSCVDCHAGSVQTGTMVNTVEMRDGLTPVTNYVPGNSYNLVLLLNDDDVMEGFQATILDASTNNMAGSFPGTGGVGTAVTNSSSLSRDYANHTTSSNTNANMFWSWVWDAPATDVGPVTVYVATNIANGNAGTGGDVIHLSQHTFGSSVGIDEIDADHTDFMAAFVVDKKAVRVSFNSLVVGNMYFNLVDLNGKSVYTERLGEAQLGENTQTVSLPESIKPGMYVVNYFVGNNPMSARVMVQ